MMFVIEKHMYCLCFSFFLFKNLFARNLYIDSFKTREPNQSGHFIELLE